VVESKSKTADRNVDGRRGLGKRFSIAAAAVLAALGIICVCTQVVDVPADCSGADKYPYVFKVGCHPVPPDTTVTPPDTIVTPPDSTVTPPDTIVTPPDSTVTPPDTTVTPPDTTVTPSQQLKIKLFVKTGSRGGTTDPPDTMTVTVTAGDSDSVKISAKPNNGYIFMGWEKNSNNGQIIEPDSLETKVVVRGVAGSVTVTAYFMLNPAGVVSGDTLVDERDSLKYTTVKIGDQTWMAENLSFKSSESCFYNKDSSQYAKYGRLYNWDEARKEVCPKGWKLPSRADWEKLVDNAGGDKIAGKVLKSKSDWKDEGNGEDIFGFSAYPGGSHDDQGNTNKDVGLSGYWWTSTENDGGDGAYSMYMLYLDNEVSHYWDSKGNGNSVRCLLVDNNK